MSKSSKYDTAIAKSRGETDPTVAIDVMEGAAELDALVAKAERFEIADLVKIATSEGAVIGVQRLKLDEVGHGVQGYLIDRTKVMVPDPQDGKERPVERITIQVASGARVAMLSLTQIEDDFRDVPADGSAWVCLVKMEEVKTKKGRTMSRFFTSYKLNNRPPTVVRQLAAPVDETKNEA